ncbi:MAG: hypothetical protein ACRC7S_15035 [Cetobacterium sp.]
MLIILAIFGPKVAMSKYFIKYVLLAEQLYFEPNDGQVRFKFVRDQIANEIGKRSFLLRRLFELIFTEKRVRCIIESTVNAHRDELDLIKQSNNQIVDNTTIVFEERLLDKLPDQDSSVKEIVKEVKAKTFDQKENSISAFAEYRTDFKDRSELRAGAAVNIKL